MIDRVRFGFFMVHFKFDSWLYFDVYPIVEWSSINTSNCGVSYIDLDKEPDTRDEFEEGKCLKKLSGSYCWRGVWEGRLYFPDQEYWANELAELSELFSKHIEPHCKKLIADKEGVTVAELDSR
jgi:hypothetical protein